MFRKKMFFAIAGVLGVLLLLAGISRSARAVEAAAPIDLEVSLAPNVTLGRVAIGEDRSVNVDGYAEDLAGGCLPVQVFIEGERAPWWPVYRCLEVAGDGAWSLRIPSDDGGSPMGIHLQIGE
jgi:hypothetical protein